jgi:hypothetical protein
MRALVTPPCMTVTFALLLMLTLVPAGCSTFSGKAEARTDKQTQVMEFLDAGKPKAALTTADDLVAESPDDYRNYLLRNAVQIVLRDYASARADNDKALEVFEATKTRYPEKERNLRLARIHESMALTALIASRRAPDEAERKRLEGVCEQEAAQVKALDEDTWNHLRGMTGDRLNQDKGSQGEGGQAKDAQ